MTVAGAAQWCVNRVVSFFEESPGVMSSTRLIGITLTAFAGVLVFSLRTYLLRCTPDAGVIASVATVLGAVIGGGAVAIFRRTGGE